MHSDVHGSVRGAVEGMRVKWVTVVLVAAVAVVGCGCAPGAVVQRGASKTSAVDLSRCAVRQLERLGYTVRDGSPESGQVRATKNTSSIRMVVFSGNDSEDQIVVATAAGGPGGVSTMRVAGTSRFWGKDTGKIAGRPSGAVAREVIRIFEACGILDAARVASP